MTSGPAIEVELKLQVPPDRLGDVIETLERLGLPGWRALFPAKKD